MKEVITPAARRLLQVVLAAGFTFALGVLAAPDLTLDHLADLGLVFLVAAAAAVINFVATVFPFFSFATLGVPQPVAAWMDAFFQAAVGTLVVTLPGALDAPNFDTAKALVVAAVIGALTAGVRALEGLFTPGEDIKPEFGLARSDSKVFGLKVVNGGSV